MFGHELREYLSEVSVSMDETVAIGADHGGYELKETIKEVLQKEGKSVIDVGTHSNAAVDYPDFAAAVALVVRDGRANRGIVICGSGVGASVAANKIPGIRAALCHDTFSAHQGVEDDNANILCLGARVIGPQLALEVVHSFLTARFSGADRHVRRLNKVIDMERKFPELLEQKNPTKN